MATVLIHSARAGDFFPWVLCTNLEIPSVDGKSIYLGAKVYSDGYIQEEQYTGYFWISLNGRANVYGGSEPLKFAKLPVDVLMGYWLPAIRQGTNLLSMVLGPVTEGPGDLRYDFYAYTDIQPPLSKGIHIKPITSLQIGTL